MIEIRKFNSLQSLLIYHLLNSMRDYARPAAFESLSLEIEYIKSKSLIQVSNTLSTFAQESVVAPIFGTIVRLAHMQSPLYDTRQRIPTYTLIVVIE
jgi:hypothetical protein